MNQLQMKLIIFAIILAFSGLSWVYQKLRAQAERRRIEVERERREIEILRTGRAPASMGPGPVAAPSTGMSLEEIAARRQAQLRELRRKQQERARQGAPGGGGAGAGGVGGAREQPIILIPGSSGPIVGGRGSTARPGGHGVPRRPGSPVMQPMPPLQRQMTRPMERSPSTPPHRSGAPVQVSSSTRATAQIKPKPQSKQAAQARQAQVLRAEEAGRREVKAARAAQDVRDVREAAQVVQARKDATSMGRLFGGGVRITAADLRRGLIVRELLAPPLSIREEDGTGPLG